MVVFVNCFMPVSRLCISAPVPAGQRASMTAPLGDEPGFFFEQVMNRLQKSCVILLIDILPPFINILHFKFG
jgi:hypothetical protein